MINKYFEENYYKLLKKCKYYTKYYEDLLHDVYIECKIREHTIKDMDKLSAFINTIIRRQAMKYYDRRELCVDYIDLKCGVEDDYSTIYIDSIQSNYSEEEKRIINLLEQGYSQKEISNILNENYNTVRTKIKRMRDRERGYK